MNTDNALRTIIQQHIEAIIAMQEHHAWAEAKAKELLDKINAEKDRATEAEQAILKLIEESIFDQLDKANGIATLDEEGKLKSNQIPDLKTINNQSIVGKGNITLDLSLYRIVDELPTSGILENKVYLVLSQDTAGNIYNEYIYVNGEWELLGSYRATIELAPYVKWTDLATSEKDGIMSAEMYDKLDKCADNATSDSAISLDELDEILV